MSQPHTDEPDKSPHSLDDHKEDKSNVTNPAFESDILIINTFCVIFTHSPIAGKYQSPGLVPSVK